MMSSEDLKQRQFVLLVKLRNKSIFRIFLWQQNVLQYLFFLSY